MVQLPSPASLPALSWFRAFEASARHLSFTAAASELSMTQSAISQHVRSLEHRLGVLLFHRRARGLALTDAGRRLLPPVNEAIFTLKEATSSFSLQKDDYPVTVAMSTSIAQWIVSPHMAEFQRQHNNIRLRLITTLWPDDFPAREADIEIRFGAITTVGTGASAYGGNSLIIVASPSFFSRKPPSATKFACLTDAPLIAPVGISDRFDHLDDNIPPPSLLVDSHGLAVNLAVAGAGYALTSAFIAEPALRTGQLQKLEGFSLKAKEHYFIHRRNRHQKEVGIVYDWLEKIEKRPESKKS